MVIREISVAWIESFLRRTGMSERQFGIEAVGDHKFLKKLRGSHGVTLTSIERAEAYIRDWRGDFRQVEDDAA